MPVDAVCRQTHPPTFTLSRIRNGILVGASRRFPNSDSYHLSLDFKPQGRTKEDNVQTVGAFIGAERYLDAYSALGIQPVTA